MKNETDIFQVKLAKPARRALANAGIKTLRQLSTLTEEELSRLHGIGPNAVTAIKKGLAEQGLSFLKKS